MVETFALQGSLRRLSEYSVKVFDRRTNLTVYIHVR